MPPVVLNLLLGSAALDLMRQSLDWRRDYIRSYLERDVPMFSPRLPAETIGRLRPWVGNLGKRLVKSLTVYV